MCCYVYVILKLGILHLVGKFNAKIMFLLWATNFHFCVWLQNNCGRNSMPLVLKILFATDTHIIYCTVESIRKKNCWNAFYAQICWTLFLYFPEVHQATISLKMCVLVQTQWVSCVKSIEREREIKENRTCMTLQPIL